MGAKNSSLKNCITIFSTVVLILICIIVYSTVTVNSLNKDITQKDLEIERITEKLNSAPNITAERINELEKKEEILLKIKKYQEIATRHQGEASGITTNLLEYYDQWYASTYGSTAEKRAINRYKEELDELKQLAIQNNELININREIIKEELYMNPDELISTNNVLVGTYEDGYYEMLNYQE